MKSLEKSFWDGESLSWYVDLYSLLLKFADFVNPRTKSMILAKPFSKHGISHPIFREAIELDFARRYAVSELQADVERELAALPEEEREQQRTKFAVFVVHNKLKPKLGSLPDDVP